MKKCIENFLRWMNRNPKTKQWGWFILLWVGGMLSFWIMAYPIKLLIKSMR